MFPGYSQSPRLTELWLPFSYWFLLPSLMMAMIGKLRGWNRTVPTLTVDWKKVVADVVFPANTEEKAIALALSSLAQQDFPYR